MSVIVGIWMAVAGVPAVLAGLSGMRRVRRLRRSGVKAWAMAVPERVTVPESADDDGGRAALQYTLADGQVFERLAPPALRPGQKVLIWYDPADPQDILVYGRDRRVSDLIFVITGIAFVLAGTALAAFAP